MDAIIAADGGGAGAGVETGGRISVTFGSEEVGRGDVVTDFAGRLAEMFSVRSSFPGGAAGGLIAPGIAREGAPEGGSGVPGKASFVGAGGVATPGGMGVETLTGGSGVDVPGGMGVEGALPDDGGKGDGGGGVFCCVGVASPGAWG